MLISRYQSNLTKEDTDMFEIIIYCFLLAPIAFCILFIIFLVISIKRGKRIKELEKEVAKLRAGYKGEVAPADSALFTPLQPVVNPYGETEYIRLPEIQSTDYKPQQTAAVSQTQAYAPQYTAAPQMPVYASQPAPQTAVKEEIPGQAATPSWAMTPAQAKASQAQQQVVQTMPAAPKKKVFSSSTSSENSERSVSFRLTGTFATNFLSQAL